MPFIIFVLLLTTTIWANVNPFVVSNTQKIKTPQTLIPIPQNQMILGDKKSIVFIAPYQKLYIFSQKKKYILANVSLDAKLFLEQKIYPNRYNNYVYVNPYAQMIAVSFDDLDKNSSFYTTINTSAINLIKAKEISLKAQSVNIISKRTLTSQKYFRLKANKTLSFDVDKNGTLALSFCKELRPIYNLSAYRQRVEVSINKKKKDLEVLNASSHSYIDTLKHKAVTGISKHFFSLNQSKHRITIKSQEDMLVSANIYHKNILYQKNDVHLDWISDKNFDFINQPIWFNSKRDNGLQRFYHLQKLQNQIVDTQQKEALDKASKKSVFYKQLYPRIFDKRGYESKFRYSLVKLYLEESKNILSKLSNDYLYNYLYQIKEGIFFDVPRGKKSKEASLSIRLEQIYFRTRGYALDKSLKAEVKNFVQHLHDYKHIYLYGHTDSTASNSYNKTLSLQRANSIRNEMICLGIDKKNISVNYLGEEKQRVKTLDNKVEDANRRVEIKVAYNATIYHKLKYQFKTPLSYDSNLQVTIVSKDKKNKKLYITTNQGKRLTLNYHYTQATESFSLDTSSLAYKNRSDKVSVLKNQNSMDFAQNTATMTVKIPKGTKFIFLSRADNAKFKVSLKMLQSSTYKDTTHNLSHQYANTYYKFYKSLHHKLSKKSKKFDPWYEDTHPLRLLLLSHIKTFQNNLTHAKVSKTQTINYAHKLYNAKDTIASKQIAKHGLFRGKNTTIMNKSYQLLLQMSQSNRERLMYESSYFYKSASMKSLENIAHILREENKNGYALKAFLLLPKTKPILKQVCDLALIENKFKLYKNLCHQTDNYMFLKKEVIKENINSYKVTNRDYKVSNYEGKKTIYSKDRNLHFPMYRLTDTHPLEIEVDADTTLILAMRFDTNTTKYQWLKIEELNRVYHYPLTNFAISKTLKILPKNRAISASNILRLTFGKGKHKIRISAYEKPLLLSIKSQKALSKDIQPLSKQILKTSSYSAFKSSQKRDKNNIAYASSLLWNYLFENLYYRKNAQAQAFLLKQTSKNREINKILSIILKYSTFTPYLSIEAPLGFYDVPTSVWNPSSQIEKNRLPLIANLSPFDIVLHGHNKKIIHLDAEENFTIEAKAFYTKYFPTQTIKFSIVYDNNETKIITINPKTQTYKHTFAIKSGRHSMKIGLINPLSSQYLAFNLCENNEAIKREVTRRYFASSHDNPIVIRDIGPKLVEIEEIDGDNVIHKSYRFYEKEKAFTLIIKPSSSSTEGLFRISKLGFNPLKKVSSHLSIASELDIPLDNTPFVSKRIFSKEQTHNIVKKVKYMPVEAHTPTLSLELKNSNIRLGSVDSNSKLTTNVFEVGVYWKSRVSKNIYLQAHYFARLYNNTLYGLKHKAYIKLPFLPNLYHIIEMNAYVQKNNNYLFKHLKIKSEIVKRDKIYKNLTQSYGVGGFKRFLDFDSSNKEKLDPQIYSDYKNEHLQGIYAKYNLLYSPYDDVKIGLKTGLHTNEDMQSIDNLKMTVNILQHIKQFDVKLSFDDWIYFKDKDRAKNYNMKRIGASVKFDKFIGTQRLHIESGAKYDFTAKSSEFSFSMMWNFSKNRRYYNLMPNTKLFTPLKRRLNDQE